jgi:hypothetical protein
MRFEACITPSSEKAHLTFTLWPPVPTTTPRRSAGWQQRAGPLRQMGVRSRDRPPVRQVAIYTVPICPQSLRLSL